MAINNNTQSFQNLFSSSEELHQFIDNSYGFKVDTCRKLAFEILELREKVESLIKNPYQGIIARQYSLEELRALGNCRILLSKAQKKLIAKTPGLKKDEELIAQRIEEIWKRTNHSEKALGLGKRYWQNNTKSPIVLLALCEHFYQPVLAQLETIIDTNDHEKILIALAELPTHLLREIFFKARELFLKKHGKEQDFTNEAFHKYLSEPKEKASIKQMLSALKDENIPTDPLYTPQYHTTMALDEFKLYEYCLEHPKFEAWLIGVIHSDHGIDIDPIFLQRFFQFHFQSSAMQGYIRKFLYEIVYHNMLENLEIGLKKSDISEFETSYYRLPPAVREIVDQEFAYAFSHAEQDQDCLWNQEKNFSILAEALKNGPCINEAIKAYQKEEFPDFQAYEIPHIRIVTILPKEKLTEEQVVQLALAQEAMSAIVHQIPYSSNFTNRENTQLHLAKRAVTTQKNLAFYDEEIQKLVGESCSFLKNPKDAKKCLPNLFTYAFFKGRVFLNYPVNNCGGLAMSMFAYLLKQKKQDCPNANVEFNNIQGKTPDIKTDHQFVFCGDFICDAWARQIYPKSLMESISKNYHYLKLPEGRPNLESFNPQYHELNTYTENVLTYEALIKKSSKSFPEIEELLNAFHQEKSKNKKIELARDILEKLYKTLSIKDLPVKEDPCHRLLSQLEYFVFGKLSPGKRF